MLTVLYVGLTVLVLGLLYSVISYRSLGLSDLTASLTIAVIFAIVSLIPAAIIGSNCEKEQIVGEKFEILEFTDTYNKDTSTHYVVFGEINDIHACYFYYDNDGNVTLKSTDPTEVNIIEDLGPKEKPYYITLYHKRIGEWAGYGLSGKGWTYEIHIPKDTTTVKTNKLVIDLWNRT